MTEIFQATAPAMQTLSTRHAVPGKELDYWHQAGETACPAHFKAFGEGRFCGDSRLSTVGELSLIDVRAGPFVAERSAKLISQSDRAALNLTLVTSGTLERVQQAEQIKLGRGSGAIDNAAYPCTLLNRGNVRMLMLQIPHAMVVDRAKGVDAVVNQDLARASALFPLVMGYATQLAECAAGLPAASARRVSSNLADLVSAMLAEVGRKRPFQLSEHTSAALMRVRTFVEQHLGNPDLDPPMVSRALRMSPRYMNKLLEVEGTSLGRLIWQRRLEWVAADLRDPLLATSTISMIALARGYNDLSHFSRSFRQRYAISPREYRALGGGAPIALKT